MNNSNEILMCTIKMKVPEGKFYGKLYEYENGRYIWRDIEGNLPPPKIDISIFRRKRIFYEQNNNNAYARSGD